jgi:WD40 repeat protein
MSTFEITIQRKAGETWPVVVEQSASGVFLPVRTEGTLELDREGLLLTQLDPKDYGTILGQAVFRDDVRDAFVQAVTKSDDRLHVLLFVEDAELRTLRWERLCAPLDGRWDFLGLNQRVPFSLYLPSVTDQRFPPIGRRDLRALVLVANPGGLDKYRLTPFDAAATVQNVRTALGLIPCEVLATVEGAVGPPTLDALCRRITAEPYTLLHIVCHGQFKGDDTILYWANADGTVEPVTGTRLLERLSRLRGARSLPRFAFLSACESAVAEAGEGLSGLAQRMVRDRHVGMPAVLAMTEKVSVQTAQRLSAAFYSRLREHGKVDLALAEACAGSVDRSDIHVAALYSRLGGQPLFSDKLDRPLTTAEIAYGLTRAEKLLAQQAPVLLSEFEKCARTLRGTLQAELEALSKDARQERDEALDAVSNLCDEALDLSFNAVALGQDPPAYDARRPFRGLYPFGRDDWEFFFGREQLVQKLELRLAEHNFLAVLGPSGSGKSSVVLAGLARSLGLKQPGFSLACLRPGSDPLSILENSLQEHPSPSLLVVDQFEELFTHCTDDDKRRAFVDRLLTCSDQRRVVLTMRADFWGECARNEPPFDRLKELMQAHQELIAPMDSIELRRAMEQQAGNTGLRFEAHLSNTVLDDVRGEPGAMPLLQHALLELWRRRHGRWLRAGEYRALGGVKQAIAETAEAVYRAPDLPSQDKDRIRDIFLRLTRLDVGAADDDDRRDTRQRVQEEDLCPAGGDQTKTRALVERLADARLLVTSVNPVTGQKEVEVAHEALIRYWPRLRDWLNEDRTTQILRQDIARAALAWEQGQQNEDLLIHRGARLEAAEALRVSPRFPLNHLQDAYVAACVELRQEQSDEKERQRQQKLTIFKSAAIVAGLLLLVACGFLAWALVSRGIAKQQTMLATDAVKSESQARSDEKKARKIAERARDRAEGQLYVSQINLAQTEWQYGTAFVAWHHLDACRWDLRGWEHDYLFTLFNKNQRPFYGHTGWVSRVAFSPDGLQIVSGSEDQTLKVWDATTGQEILTLKGHTDGVEGVAFSPDGKRIVSGSSDHTLKVWDATAGQEIRTLKGHTGWVGEVAFSPDGKQIVSGSGDQTLKVWDATAGQEIRTLKGHTDGVGCVAFSPDGKRIVSGSFDQTLKLWNATTGQETLTLKGHTHWVTSAAFSPDGKQLVSGSWDQTLKVWDATTGQETRTLKGHTDRVESVAFSPDGKQIVSGGDDETLKVWDATTGQETQILKGHTREVLSVAFSPDGKRIAGGSRNGILELWDATTGQEARTLNEHTSGVSSVAFSPDGKQIVSGSYDQTLKVWDATTGQETRTLKGHTDEVRSVSFSPDGKQIASGSGDHTLKVWDATTGHQTLTLKGHTGGVICVAFSRDGKQIVSGSNDQTLKVWDATTGQETLTLQGHTGWVGSVAFSPDGKRIVSGSWDKTLKVWDATTGQETLTLQGHTRGVRSVAFSPDGKQIVSGSWDQTLKVWDATTGQETLTLKGHTDVVFGVAFSPDGDRIVSGSGDQTLKVWNVTTGQETLTLKGHTDGVTSVAFRPDGKQIVSGSDDQTLKVWDATVGQETRTLQGHTWLVFSVAFRPDGRQIVSGSYDQTLKVWDATTGQETLALKGHTDGVFGVAFSPDGKQIVSGNVDQTLKLWDATTGHQTLTLEGHTGAVFGVAFSPDGKQIVSGSHDRTLKVWDATTGREILTLKGHIGRVSSVAFSPDGKQIVSASHDRTLKVWDATTGHQTLTLNGHVGEVLGVAFSPDGRQIVSGSYDQTLRVWDATTGHQTLTLNGHTGGVLCVAFSPNGKQIVSGSGDETLKVWDATTGQETLTLKGHTGVVNSVAFRPDGMQIVSGSGDQTLKIWLLDRWLQKAGQPDRNNSGKPGPVQ